MQKWMCIIVVLLWQQNKACNSLEEAQEIAMKSNRFVLAYFSETTRLNSNNGKSYFWLEGQDKHLYENYFTYNVYKDFNKNYLKKYSITSLPILMILDGNGKEIYRYSDYKNPSGFKAAFVNFVLPKNSLSNDLSNFHNKKSFNSATRIAQQYLDFSLIVEDKFRVDIYKVSKSYIEEAEELLKKEKSADKLQSLALLKLFDLAYKNDFLMLNEKLRQMNSSSISEVNLNKFYFLKYITAKALNTSDFQEIETRIKAINGFDVFIKKIDLILQQSSSQ